MEADRLYSIRPEPGASVNCSLKSVGFPSPAEDYQDKGLDLNEYLVRNWPATFLVKVAGNAMRQAGIHDQDLLVVDRSLAARNDHIVVAVVEGEFLVRRLKKMHGRMHLHAEDRHYTPLTMWPGMQLEIWGVVTYVIHATR